MYTNHWSVVRIEAGELVRRAKALALLQADEPGVEQVHKALNRLLERYYNDQGVSIGELVGDISGGRVVQTVHSRLQRYYIANPAAERSIRLYQLSADGHEGLCPCGVYLAPGSWRLNDHDRMQEPTHLIHDGCGRYFNLATGAQTAHHAPRGSLVS